RLELLLCHRSSPFRLSNLTCPAPVWVVGRRASVDSRARSLPRSAVCDHGTKCRLRASCLARGCAGRALWLRLCRLTDKLCSPFDRLDAHAGRARAQDRTGTSTPRPSRCRRAASPSRPCCTPRRDRRSCSSRLVCYLSRSAPSSAFLLQWVLSCRKRNRRTAHVAVAQPYA